jgi:hypothetical protein
MVETPIAEPTEAFVWIRQQLQNNGKIQAVSGLVNRIWWGTAPDEAAYPFITINSLSAEDLMGVGATIIWADLLILVRVTGDQASTYPLRDIVVGIQEALHKKSGTTSVARIVSSVRERPHIMPPEKDGDNTYTHVGGEYRIKVRPL